MDRYDLILFLENELELLYHENENTYSTDNCIDSIQEFINEERG